MTSRFIWPLFIIISASTFIFFLLYPSNNNGGDMVEYFGMTESLINHKGINLTQEDYSNLKKYLSPGYFAFEQKYEETKGGFMSYVQGQDGQKYALHFFFYSLLAVPVRLFIRLFSGNELNTLRLTNWLLVTFALAYLLKYVVKNTRQQTLLLATFFLSPLVFFTIYPGVDIFYTIFLLLGGFCFFHKKYIRAVSFITIASWHSQPLIILAAAATLFYLHIEFVQAYKKHNTIHIPARAIFFSIAIGFLALIPYFTNYYLFGVWSPWKNIADGWTQVYGFGLQNIGLQRLFEQFFDLNVGLFWYAPAFLILGGYYMTKLCIRNKAYWLLVGLIIITAFAYQTNPAWHYGSAGFAPTRHVLFIIPFLIYFITSYFKPSVKLIIIIAVPLLFQLYALSFNNYLAPVFYNSLFHNPYATYVLNNYPFLYRPTPKIFVDDTTHTDKKFIFTAIYRYNDTCKKAYVVKTDKQFLEHECGSIPKQYLPLLDNEFSRKANYERTTFTSQATFWADPYSCGPDYKIIPNTPFLCLHTLADVKKYTGLTDVSRIKPVVGYEGAWKLEKGDVVQIIIPPGYIIDYQSLEGIYVDY